MLLSGPVTVYSNNKLQYNIPVFQKPLSLRKMVCIQAIRKQHIIVPVNASTKIQQAAILG